MVRILSPGHPGKKNFRRSGGFLPPIYHIPTGFPIKTVMQKQDPPAFPPGIAGRIYQTPFSSNLYADIRHNLSVFLAPNTAQAVYSILILQFIVVAQDQICGPLFCSFFGT
jgi:hypothetical protein